MHKLNKLFNEVTDELWAIKRCKSEIEFSKLIDFYREYQFHANLVVDVINEQIYQYAESSGSHPNQEEIFYMIDAFITYNKYNYDRLIVDSLCLLNCEAAYEYLNKILDTNEKKEEFERDFKSFPLNEHIKQQLRKLGNSI